MEFKINKAKELPKEIKAVGTRSNRKWPWTQMTEKGHFFTFEKKDVDDAMKSLRLYRNNTNTKLRKENKPEVQFGTVTDASGNMTVYRL